MNKVKDIIIIGAGPAGISLARELKQRDVLILEKGNSPGFSWGQMPDDYKLISTPSCNNLTKRKLPKYYQEPASEFKKYLETISKSLIINFNQEVISVLKVNDLFIITTQTDSYTANKVIISTGYYSTPHIPEEFKEIKHKLHSSEYKNFTLLKERYDLSKVLIIGKRISAGQILEELLLKNLNIHLYTKKSLTMMGKLTKYYSGFYCMAESLMLKMSESKSTLDVPMEYSEAVKTALQSGQLGLRTEFRPEDYSLIIMATGFRPSLSFLDHMPELKELKNQFEDTKFSRMYYLGFDCQVNYSSRFLRGIRRDAKSLAKII
jgi:lysine/ornithine N-monooxygenase